MLLLALSAGISNLSTNYKEITYFSNDDLRYK